MTAIGAAAQRFAEVDVRLALVALGFHLANHVLRSVAWRNVLRAAFPAGRVATLDVVSAYALGVALNAVLPARGGDAAKVALVRARIPGSNVPTVAASMSVIVLFDLIAATTLVAAVCLTGVAPFAPQLPSADAPARWLVTHGWIALLGLGAAVLAVRALGPRARARLTTLRAKLRQGGAILGTPGRYVREVVLAQAAAWACRIAVVFCLLAAFRLEASVPIAALVMVASGLSTLVPLTPGGAGTQQLMLAFALSQTATAAAAVSFSLGMQAGITLVNAILGVAAAMVAFRTLRPLIAVRAGLRAARA